MEYNKIKSVAKQVRVNGPGLEKTILDTMRTIGSVVGATLGPNGRPVLIERQEHGLPPIVTKDGVTVFRSLGFEDSTQHCIMEAARDAAVRTATEAGDGTTTATVLAEAIVTRVFEFCRDNPKYSPQKVVRKLETTFRDIIEPAIRAKSIQANFATDGGRTLLRAVANISANGDADLADAVIQCFDAVGDEGNVTITEVSGRSHYEIERVDGYPLPIGYEECCFKFYPKFVNDPGTQRCVLENPVFVCYHGKITEIQTVLMLMEKIGHAWETEKFNHNVVLVATGFSETVLANLAINFEAPHTINVFPLTVPQSPMPNGQLDTLRDICAITGSALFDPMNAPLDRAELDDLGKGCTQFEASRGRSNILGHADSNEIELLVDHLKTQLENPISELDRLILQERIGKITGGIARLKVVGASNGELKEKRDRAEDAVCAVRGAMKHGCLPGGGWMLVNSAADLPEGDLVLDEILATAMLEPVDRMLSNCGLSHDERESIIQKMGTGSEVYDAMEGKFVEPIAGGILDSTPAVLEAVRNAISIASLLGTLGGAVCYGRDLELERKEALATAQHMRDSNTNPANERW